MLRVLLTLLAVYLALSMGDAFAAAPAPITWAGDSASQGLSPSAFCALQAEGALTQVEYGYPSTFRCVFNNGTYNSFRSSMPSCGAGYIVDFSKQLCMPTGSGLDELLNLSASDAVSLTWMILLLWVIAWVFRQLANSLKSNPGETND